MFEDDEDPFVPVWEGPSPEGERVLRRLEAAHIPVDFGEPPQLGYARVEVPRSYEEDARALLREADLPTPSYGWVDRPATFDWQPWVRIALVVMAVILIVALLLT